MLLQSLGALCKAPGESGSIWKYFEALARATGVSGRFAYGFRTELHFAHEVVYIETISSHRTHFVHLPYTSCAPHLHPRRLMFQWD